MLVRELFAVLLFASFVWFGSFTAQLAGMQAHHYLTRGQCCCGADCCCNPCCCSVCPGGKCQRDK